MLATQYREHKFWSIVHGCDVSRVMMAGTDGREYFAVIERGQGYAARRESALAALTEAIAAGEPPGEVDAMGLWPAHNEAPPAKPGPAPTADETIRYEPT